MWRVIFHWRKRKLELSGPTVLFWEQAERERPWGRNDVAVALAGLFVCFVLLFFGGNLA